MLDSLRSWVITICGTVFFITAVEIILPDNKMKKYVKFVLGLILITVIINPILKVISNKQYVDSYSNNITNYISKSEGDTDYEKYKQDNMQNTLNSFKSNLADSCSKILEKKYPENSFKVDVDASYDKEDNIDINTLKIGIKDGSVEKVKKVEIDLDKKPQDNNSILNDSKSNEIKNYISSELNVPESSITIYKY
ncbi:MAG: stage III sporulation protein AF [Bacillota bacterium]|nr:stage III sporulation protein AF [Bacillota bacterium]